MLAHQAEKVVKWLHEWSSARGISGLPKTNMPVKKELQPYGVVLIHEASPTNRIKVLLHR
jgi:hypothetical protein